MKENEKIVYVGGGGIGMAGTLTLIFIVLRLLDIIDWSWWWVLSPLWISALLYGLFLIICLIIMIIIGIIIAKKAHTQNGEVGK